MGVAPRYTLLKLLRLLSLLKLFKLAGRSPKTSTPMLMFELVLVQMLMN